MKEKVDRELRRPELDRRLVTALVVGVLDRTLLRVGNTEYRNDNQSYGLTTLEDDHVELSGLRRMRWSDLAAASVTAARVK
ncbi:MAG: hypothetical protein Q7W51_08810 [Coriobacteriia bacterium]|nr:hypothetical protein [Coriobacteriia bacterium]